MEDNTDYTFEFAYDEGGKPFSVTYNMLEGSGILYYVYSLQGDVIKLVNEYGEVVVEYTYDEWGNCTMQAFPTEDDAYSDIGELNPFRYRGYYYDPDIGLYHCGTRFYDPNTGRWINADNVIAGVGGDVQGYNLFAYCANNPTNLSDSTGQWPKLFKSIAKAVVDVVKKIGEAVKQVGQASAKGRAALEFVPSMAKIAVASGVALLSGNATVSDVANDLKAYEFWNSDETKVLQSKVFSSYNGTPVIRHSIPEITSFSIFNTIMLNTSEIANSDGINTVRHEWGHTVQQSLIGTPRYIGRIAIPSVIGCMVNPSSKTYYSLPWERSADYFSGTNRSTGYHRWSAGVAALYFIMS